MNLFARSISFTITNRCNLHCAMCGQWNKESGYMKGNSSYLKSELETHHWIDLINQIAEQGLTSFLIRGGEPFSYKGIIEILKHANKKGLFTAIDTNGTLLETHAEVIASLGKIHLTISVDGPEEIHDQVRGLPGCFSLLRKGIQAIQRESQKTGNEISLSLNFTISPYSLQGLGAMAETARQLQVKQLCIVPYYWVPKELGLEYEKVMQKQFNTKAYSWKGFHSEKSGVDLKEFQKQYQQLMDTLGEIKLYPYMELSLDEYLNWFLSPDKAVLQESCPNSQGIIDVQPNGDANFCVDFPDYTFGNIKNASLEKLWNSPEAQAFRDYRKKNKMGVCHRCGAKYMAAQRDSSGKILT